MSMNEMEGKIRELRSLQRLIEEAEQEAEAIKAQLTTSTTTRRVCPPQAPDNPAQAQLQGMPLFLVLDNLKVHHGKLAAAWLEKNTEKMEVFFLHPSLSYLCPQK